MIGPEHCRRPRRWVLVAGGMLFAGCSIGQQGLNEPARSAILDAYAAGLTVRRKASRAWIEGNNAWELNFFSVAAEYWCRAGERFDAARDHFRGAEDDCVAGGAETAALVCSEARNYCGYMSEAATEHAVAADAYAAGHFGAGDRHLEAGFEHYSSALNHEVPPIAELRTALDKSS